MNLPGSPDSFWSAPSNTEDLPAYVESTGWSQETSDYWWDGLARGSRGMGILQYTLSGHGWVERGGQRWLPAPGDLMMVTVPDAHVYGLPPSGGRWEFVYVCVCGESALSWIRNTVARFGPVHRMDPSSSGIEELIRVYRDAAAGRLGVGLENSRAAWSLVARLCQEVQQLAAGQVPSGFDRLPDWVEDHLHELIGVEDMARVTGFSRYHFSRLFREKYGDSPGRYLEQQRIRRAVRLLQETSAAISEIGEQCGFHDANYFARVFRKVTGDSPRDFRHRLGR